MYLDSMTLGLLGGKGMKAMWTKLAMLTAAAFVVAGPLASAVGAEPLCTVAVKILVDQKEPAVQQIWEKRYRDRLAAASDIFERTCHVRFQVVAFGTWSSDDKIHDFLQLVNDFDRKVNPAPAQLAIGFTGQYNTLLKDVHIGASRGPFRSHILIREWGRDITEPERLEILVHEMGHFLGAVHSPEQQSVMRPDISDRQSRLKDFRISFDARNATIMSLIGVEMGKHRLFHLGQLPPATKQQLGGLYRALAKALPSDPAAPRYLAMLEQSVSLPPGHGKDPIPGAPRDGGLNAAGPNLLPKYKGELTGANQVQIVNPNNFKVWVGLRSAGKGKDFTVIPGGKTSVRVPDGSYEIYIVCSSDPNIRYTGNGFVLRQNGVSFQLPKIANNGQGAQRAK
jgi:hypothetical protein